MPGFIIYLFTIHPFTIHHSPFTIHHSPFTRSPVHHSPVHHSPIHPFTHSPFTHSPFTIHSLTETGWCRSLYLPFSSPAAASRLIVCCSPVCIFFRLSCPALRSDSPASSTYGIARLLAYFICLSNF